MKYEEFLELSVEKKVVAGITIKNAHKVFELLPKRYQVPTVFWTYVWMLSIPVFMLVAIFYNWLLGLSLLFLLTPMIMFANQKSVAQFVLEHAIENKLFFEFLDDAKLLDFTDLSQKEPENKNLPKLSPEEKKVLLDRLRETNNRMNKGRKDFETKIR